MPDESMPAPGGEVRLTRREFIRLGAGTVSAIAVAPALAAAPAAAPSSERTAYPVRDIARLDAIAEGATLQFTYPDPSSPAILLRLRQSAPGGIGPNQTIVAFSRLCTHKGCPVAYEAAYKLLICPCHWSSFDPAKAGELVIGQASEALPQIELRVTDGMVQAVGVSGLIYGRQTNIF